MTMFKAYSPKVEVNGETVLSVVDGMGAFKSQAYKILEINGIVDPKPGQWYSQQAWLDAFKDISNKVGYKTLFMIGKKIPENAAFPPHIKTVEEALASIDAAYHMNHRHGKIGKYHFQKLTENSGKMVCENPYPCDFDMGIIDAMVRRFVKKSAQVDITHDTNETCRKKGAESCVYLIQW